MNLNELTRPIPFDPEIKQAADTHYQNRYTDFYEALQEQGWHRRGEGSFSDVFFNSKKNYILKVNIRPDRAFAWFAFLTKKFPNPHFPMIGNMKLYKHGPEKYHIYLIEKLDPIDETPDMNDLVSLMDNYAANWRQFELEKFKKWYEPSTVDYLETHPKLREALEIIGGYSKGHMIDIHNKNVMKRTDGTLVITDPLAY